MSNTTSTREKAIEELEETLQELRELRDMNLQKATRRFSVKNQLEKEKIYLSLKSATEKAIRWATKNNNTSNVTLEQKEEGDWIIIGRVATIYGENVKPSDL
ncbi:MAG: hypothetical protein ACOC5T_02635 [Elusimicrobiota bacterium]